MTLKHSHQTAIADDPSYDVGGDEWNADHTVGGTSLQVQYNNAGSLTGMAGTSWDDTNRALTLTGATVTASNPLFNLTQTWNGPLATTNFTAFKINVTNTQSDETSRLFDYQVGGTSVFRGNRQGGLLINLTSADGNVGDANMLIDAGGSTLSGTPVFHVRTPNSGSQKAFQLIRQGDGTGWASFEYFGGHPGFAVSDGSVSRDTQICRYGVATWQFGLVDGAAPVSQTIQAQSVVAGTSNTAGVDLVIKGSVGTGTGAGGNIVFKTAPAGTSGTSQNTATTAFTIRSDGTTQLVGFTVATLPTAGTVGRRAYVTDATAPTYNGALTGGGAVVVPVFDNGSAWVSA